MRYKKEASAQLTLIRHEKTMKDKKERSSRYGLKDYYNPLQKLSVDLYRFII